MEGFEKNMDNLRLKKLTFSEGFVLRDTTNNESLGSTLSFRHNLQ
jgi:hypothetical protein